MCGIRSAKYQLFPFIGLPLCGMIAAMIAYNWVNWSGGMKDTTEVTENPPARETEVEPKRADEAVGYQKRIAELEVELADARSQIANMQSLRAQEWSATADLVEALTESQAQSGLRQVDVDRIMDKTMQRTFEGLEDGIYALMRISALGEDGAKAVAAAVRDPKIPMNKRKELLGVAAYLPYPQALDLVLNPPDEVAKEGFAFQQAMGGVARSLEVMPAPEASRYIAPLRALNRTEILKIPNSGEAWRLAAALAFVHGDAQSRQWFSDPVRRQAGVEAMLDALKWVRTEESWTLVEEISRTDPRPDVRKTAAEVLTRW